MKISNLLLIILFCFGLKTVGQDRNVSNDSIFILIDPQFKELYSFSKETNGSPIAIKILHYDKRELGFETQTKELKDNEIVIVPEAGSNYIEFLPRPNPKETSSIKDLKTFTIEDVSKGDKNVWGVWQKTSGYFYFIEELESGNYLIWKTSVLMDL